MWMVGICNCNFLISAFFAMPDLKVANPMAEAQLRLWRMSWKTRGQNWLVVYHGIPTPLKNISSSVGIMTFPISIYIYIGKIKFMFQTTNQFISSMSSMFMYHIFTVSETHSLRTRTDFREKKNIIAARNPQLTSNISSTKPPKAVWNWGIPSPFSAHSVLPE